MTTQYNLTANAYLAPDVVIAQMANDYANALSTGATVRGEYLRILFAHSRQALTAKLDRADPKTAAAVLNTTHDRLYSIILTAVTTVDVAPLPDLPAEEQRRRTLERNRRSNFARTAKSTILAFVKSGGDMLQLRPEDVTKEQLRALTALNTPSAPETETAAPRALESKLKAYVKELAEKDREGAIEFVNDLHLSLLQMVAVPLTNRQMKRGELTLTPAH